MSTMGQRIREAREKKGWLQSQLAEAVGVKSAGVISNWEKDLNKPDAEKIVKLCFALDITASYLLDYYGNEQHIALNEYKIIKKYRALDERGKEAVDIMLNTQYERCNETKNNSETASVFRAARSSDNKPPERIQMSKEELDRLFNLPHVTSDEEL